MAAIGTTGQHWQTPPMHSGDFPTELTTILDSLFPPGVASILSLNPDHRAELGPLEIEAAGRFVPSRLAEFRHGRACARQALARLGVAAGDIPVGPSREPIWPGGIVGSITHAGTAAAAVVAPATEFTALGLDLETGSALEAGLASRICLPAEMDRILATTDDPGRAAKMVFSIKEAAYKALWPTLRRILDFHDIEIRLDGDGSGFTVLSRSDLCPAEVTARIEGRCMGFGDYFAAGAAMRA